MSIGAQQFIDLLHNNKALADERDQLRTQAVSLHAEIVTLRAELQTTQQQRDALEQLCREAPEYDTDLDADGDGTNDRCDAREWREWMERRDRLVRSAGADKPSDPASQAVERRTHHIEALRDDPDRKLLSVYEARIQLAIAENSQDMFTRRCAGRLVDKHIEALYAELRMLAEGLDRAEDCIRKLAAHNNELRTVISDVAATGGEK
jgi:prefoldin subunit 5